MRLLVSIVALTLPAGCGAGAFACGNDVDCEDGGVAGTCEPGGGCSFPDDDCASGKRYGEHAPDGLGGVCVPLDAGTETTGGSVATTLATTMTGGTLESGDTTTTTDASTTTTTDPESSSSEVTTGTVDTTGDGPAVFFDPFDRRNADELGNGWIEKTPGAFQIVDQRVVLATANGGNFRDNICYRPTDESLLDVEVTLVFSYDGAAPIDGFPQLHVRVQSDTVAAAGTLDSYAVFIDTTDLANPLLTVNRIAGMGFGDATSTPVAIEVGPRYRLRGRVTGTDEVMIEGFLERESDGGWEVVGETVLVDPSVDRLSMAGTFGLSGHEDLAPLALDDFGYAEIGP